MFLLELFIVFLFVCRYWHLSGCLDTSSWIHTSIDGWTSVKTFAPMLMNIVVLRLCIQCGRPVTYRGRKREREKRRITNRHESNKTEREREWERKRNVVQLLSLSSLFLSLFFYRRVRSCFLIHCYHWPPPPPSSSSIQKWSIRLFESLPQRFPNHSDRYCFLLYTVRKTSSIAMGANDSPITTRSVVNDYFEWRFNNKTTSNSPLFVSVRALASQCESAYRAKHPNFSLNSFSSTTTTDVPTLNTIKCIHDEIAKEMFSDGTISWSRIITLISFSAILTEHAIQQSSDQIPASLIISSMADWTIHFIDTDLQTWLRNQNYWVHLEIHCYEKYFTSYLFFISRLVVRNISIKHSNDEIQSVDTLEFLERSVCIVSECDLSLGFDVHYYWVRLCFVLGRLNRIFSKRRVNEHRWIDIFTVEQQISRRSTYAWHDGAFGRKPWVH